MENLSTGTNRKTRRSTAGLTGINPACGVTYLTTSEIHPFIRYISLTALAAADTIIKRKTYDCRLLYVCDGPGQLVIYGKTYELERGNLFVWPPAVEYSLKPRKGSVLKIMVANYDYTSRFATVYPTAITSDTSEKFNLSRLHEFCVFTDNTSMNGLIFLKKMQDEEPTLTRIVKELQFKGQNYILKSRSMFLGLMCRIITLASSDEKLSETAKKLDSILEYLHSNYNKPMSNKEIGEIFNFNPVYLNRLMVNHTGYPLHRYILNYRIHQALDLLHSSSKPISEISYEVGFDYYNNFSSCFRKVIGMSPKQYLKSGNI